MDSERAEYLREIEQTFVGLRGRGFLLSPRDVALIDDWRQRGVPARVIVRALRDGARRFRNTHPTGTPLPATLAYFASQIEQQIGVRRERSLGYGGRGGAAGAGAAAATVEAQAAASQRVLDALTAAGRALEDDAPREVLRQAYRLIRGAAAKETFWETVREVDARVVADLSAGLDAAALEALQSSAEAELDAGGRSLSPQARDRRVKAAVERQVRVRFGLPDLVEVALGTDQ